MKNNDQKYSWSDAISQIKFDLNVEQLVEENESQKSEILDIISFCNSPKHLNLPAEKMNLYPSQRVILKCFYKGTPGNENTDLTEEEWNWLYENEEEKELDGVKYENNVKDVIQKMLKRDQDPDMEVFSYLHLVLGRRASKTVMASIITAYEAYKLLVINNGDPHGQYDLPNDDEIAIINVALSQQQAGRLFGQIQTRIRNSPFLKTRIAKETSSEIRLYTDSDLAKIKQFKEEGIRVNVPGSILLLCGHSNPDSLRGYSAIMLLFDEIAFYDESGKVTGKFFFNSLKPSLSKFFKYEAGKIVMISSPHVRNGIFYDTWEAAKDDDGILSFQLPTWCVNPDVPYDQKELVRDRKANPEMFSIEYGAQWATGGSYGNYFDSDLIDRAIRTDIFPHTRSSNIHNYYLHIDPAKNNNNYAACLIAQERYINNRGQKRKRCILAGTWVWRPVPGMGLLFNEIDKEVLAIARIFRPVMITYDTFNSKHSLELLRSSGFNCRELTYNRGVKTKIYQNLKDLMLYQPVPELQLYPHGGEAELLISEMKEIKYKSLQRGYTLMPDKNGEVGTDDLLDCLAGACYMANEGHREALPAPVTVQMGYF